MAELIVDNINKKVTSVIGEDRDPFVFGDENTIGYFAPSVRINRWKNENGLQLNLDGFVPVSDLLSSNQTAIVMDLKDGYQFYVEDNPGQEGMKFGLIFTKVPQQNRFSFSMAGWEEFNFVKQPTLYDEWDLSADKIKFPTFADYTAKHFRPLRVENSFAVYHKTKQNYRHGGTNYRTGKFCHFYRPRAIDAEQNFVWCDLGINNGKYTITIDRNFLRDAVYPVKVNDEFGYHPATPGSYNYSASSDTVALKLEQTSPAGGGTLNYVYIYCLSQYGNQRLKFGAYVDSAGAPATRLCYEDTFVACGVAGWRCNPTDFATVLAASTQYWAAMSDLPDSNGIACYYDASGIGTDRCGSGTLFPSPWSGASSDLSGVQMAAYFEYTPPAGGLSINVADVLGQTEALD